MAKFIFDDGVCLINSVDLSDHVRSITVNDESEDHDVTAMGANSRQRLLGLGDANIEIELYQDFAAGEVHATLQPLKGSNTPFPVFIKPTSAAISATNPQVQMAEAVMPNYTSLDGEVGEPSMVTATFLNAGQAGIVYDITP